MINDFRGEYRFLSNFHIADVVYEGITYPSSEAAFQAAKSLDGNIRRHFTKLSCKEAKEYGRHVELRSDWETVKNDVMYAVTYDKFTRHQELKVRLLQTGDEKLIEGNTWGDTYWGVCNGKGKNMLGKTLMRVRDEIRRELKADKNG